MDDAARQQLVELRFEIGIEFGLVAALLYGALVLDALCVVRPRPVPLPWRAVPHEQAHIIERRIFGVDELAK